jgi:hypothetical protein
MNGYDKATLMPDLVARFPGFEDLWLAHLDYWEGEPAGLCNDMAEFAVYVGSLLQENTRTPELETIFAHAESLLADGSDEVKDAVATCFLENIVNTIGPDTGWRDLFAGLLGPKSRAYCNDWDAFTGGTPGAAS